LADVHPDLKVLYMSGYTETGIAPEGTAEPVLNFLPKPFQPQELLWRISEALAKKTAPAKLLVVDDDAQMRAFLAALLESRGYRVFEACNGKEAQARCRAILPDLVIMDLVMPDQEGVETIHTISQCWPHLPVIAISGASGGVYLDLARKMGADAVIRKPFEPDLILKEVRRLTLQ
jgi:DNA-binding response OmpR family regulator